MRAIGDTIILKPFRMEQKTESGIEIVQDKYERHNRDLSVGQVIDIGPTSYTDEMYIEKEFNQTCAVASVGDLVMTAKDAGYEYEINGVVYRNCLPADLNVVITEDELDSLTTWTAKAA